MAPESALRTVVIEAHADELAHLGFEVGKVLGKADERERVFHERVVGAPAVHARGMEEHGVEQAVSAFGRKTEVRVEACGELLEFVVVGALERGEALDGHVRLDDGE